MNKPTDALGVLDQKLKKRFETNRRVLSFDEYMTLLADRPEKQLRGSAQLTADMLDFYGKTPLADISHKGNHEAPSVRFNAFDFPVDGYAPKVVGHEDVQTELYNSLKSFTRQGINNKLLLLHGPNGSAKSTLTHALMCGLERYSHEEEGAVYTFNWVFPVERHTKGSLGIQSYTGPKDVQMDYSKLAEDEVAAKIPCELKDHPILLVPAEERKNLLQTLIGKEKAESLWKSLPNYLTHGELCHRCNEIFEALLTANGGDYRRVVRHIQVERFYFSRRYKTGLSTIEPQLHVDAQYQQLTLNKNITSLPASLQSLNLFSVRGEVVEGNRGIIEFSDMLKRPLDSFKYLLSACENGAVNVGSTIVYLDSVMIASSNELQLDAFKEFPDFNSFKARFKLIRVPYLLRFTQEEEIYSLLVSQFAGDKHIAPHVPWTLALWAVLSRMKKPNSINYPPALSTLISNITPIEKARLFNTGEMPVNLTPEDKKLLRSHLPKLWTEYTNIPYYEGRMGASVREVKSIIFDALQNQEYPCLSPLAIFVALEDFVKKINEYEFLKQDVKDGYHDVFEFIQTVKEQYLDRIDNEMRASIGFYDQNQWEDFIRKYVIHVAALLKSEKVQNPMTGKLQDPDHSLIREFETIVGAPKPASSNHQEASANADLFAFRKNVIGQVGAWSLDHPNQMVVYRKVFPEYWKKLEKHYFDSQRSIVTKMHTALQVYGTDDADLTSEDGKLAHQTIESMVKKQGYCENCAKEAIMFLLKKRY